MWLVKIFGINQDVIQIYYNEDIKFFSEDLVDVALKTGWYIEKIKRHDLVLKVAVSGAESRFSLVAFSDSHPMIGTNEIQLGKPLGPA